MNTDHNNSAEDAVLLDWLERAVHPTARRSVPESVLWAYAFGKLDAVDEQRVLSELAHNDEARARLAELRQRMQQAAARRDVGVVTAAAIPVSVLAALKVMGQSLVAGFVRSAEGLQTEILDVLWALRLPESALLGEVDACSSGSLPSAFPVQEIVSAEGLKVKVIDVPGVGVSFVMQMPPDWPDGTAKLFHLTMRGGSLISDPLDNVATQRGSCQFSDCPSGLLKILAPNGKSVVVFVGDPPRAATSSAD